MKTKNILFCAIPPFLYLAIIILIMSSISPISPLYAQDIPNNFPMFKYNLQRTGRVPFAGPSDNSLKWSISTAGEIWSSPVVNTEGVVYIGSTDGSLLAITPKGKVMWAFKAADEIFVTPAIGTDGTIYFGSADGRFCAVHPDGKLKWKFQTKGAIHSSPVIDKKGTVYFGSYDGKLYAIAS
ncbi:MAG: PQQ-binding-like beta-propeller repeat protein, partial [Candidatus Jettenia caeni]|nr:PQQ-binding-like beta-propeller repeat protein [Candidatus Jettenia caeni]